jgi:phosphoribosylanthranilate isomerase
VTRVKICGITSVEDALAAAAAGADEIGLVFARSPRQVDPEAARAIVRALPGGVGRIGVFRDAAAETIVAIAGEVGLDAVQLHGEETPELARAVGLPVIRRVRPAPDEDAEALARRVAPWSEVVFSVLVDPGAGEGRVFDWRIAHGLPGRIVVAGGLSAENVGAAIRAARPFAVDVASGVERAPGVKDPRRLLAFVHAVREEDATRRAR